MHSRHAALVLVAVAALASAQSQPGYAGPGQCRGCHTAFYSRWSTSHHGLALQPYTPELARTALTFPTTPIAAGAARYTVRDGWMEDSVSRLRLPIRYAIGGKDIYYFLTTLERGYLQVMPLAYDVRARLWMDSTASMAGQPDAVEWRHRSLTFNTSCSGCHVSQFQANYDPVADAYRSNWREPGIDCEACHGPALNHVTAMRGGAPKDLGGILSFKRLNVAQRNDACLSCHSKQTPITAAYRPGEPFYDHFDLTTLESDDFYSDGRDKRENYTATTWLQSACVRAGSLDCLHCHTSSGRYRFTEPEHANDACLPCHAARVRDVAAHSHHAAGSPASRCVACHMPTTEYARMRRSDHSMRPPMPALSVATGSPNACNLCHSDKDARWADTRIRSWTQRDYQAATLRQAALVDAARHADWSHWDDIAAALARRSGDEAFRATLIRLLGQSEERRAAPVLARAAADPSPLIRSSAIEALGGLLDGQTVALVARAAQDPVRLVRIRAGAALAALDPALLAPESRPAVGRAVAEYVESLRARPDDYSGRLNLGVFYAGQREFDKALNEYGAALRLRPDYPPALINVALVYAELGQSGQAENALRRAIAADPRNAAAQLNLGLLLAAAKRTAEAVAALRRASELDPRDAVAPYNLALLIAPEQPAEAVDWARRAVANAPGEARYAEALRYLSGRATAP